MRERDTRFFIIPSEKKIEEIKNAKEKLAYYEKNKYVDYATQATPLYLQKLKANTLGLALENTNFRECKQ